MKLWRILSNQLNNGYQIPKIVEKMENQSFQNFLYENTNLQRCDILHKNTCKNVEKIAKKACKSVILEV